jgi:hypothetical protein
MGEHITLASGGRRRAWVRDDEDTHCVTIARRYSEAVILGGSDGSDVGVVPGPLRLAVVLILVETLALLGAVGFLVYDTITGRPDEVARALLGAAIALVGAAGLAAGARGLWRLSAAARSPIVVVQLLALPVGYSLGFQAGVIGIGGPIMVIALAVLFLLFTPPARAALDRDPLN